MIDEQSRAGEYLRQAATLRRLAGNTQYPDVRERLLWMAAGFERLSDQLENWKNTRLATAAD